jgi:hypothetical protein
MGWNPFKDSWSGVGKALKTTFGSSGNKYSLGNIVSGGGYNLIGSNFKGGSPVIPEQMFGSFLGYKTQGLKGEEQRGKDRAEATKNAAVRQAEYEEQASMGAERTRAKRRRGFQSTILTGPGEATGLGSSGGKTLLGE